jgi:hypothetical protein
MNPADQRAHTTKTAQLEARIVALEGVLDHVAQFLAAWSPMIDQRLQLHSTTLAALTLSACPKTDDPAIPGTDPVRPGSEPAESPALESGAV